MRHCPIFIWIHTPLKEYQGKYVYINDVQVILLALIDYIIQAPFVVKIIDRLFEVIVGLSRTI